MKLLSFRELYYLNLQALRWYIHLHYARSIHLLYQSMKLLSFRELEYMKLLTLTWSILLYYASSMQLLYQFCEKTNSDKTHTECHQGRSKISLLSLICPPWKINGSDSQLSIKSLDPLDQSEGLSLKSTASQHHSPEELYTEKPGLLCYIFSVGSRNELS